MGLYMQTSHIEDGIS